mmetsp:Transcript_1349/g.3685  ORF Transcript_1349/g.3685 Transcript_1349/m.3685 type:complete len:87 (-) Transcript_1349:122-382(-)
MGLAGMFRIGNLAGSCVAERTCLWGIAHRQNLANGSFHCELRRSSVLGPGILRAQEFDEIRDVDGLPPNIAWRKILGVASMKNTFF